MAEPNQPPLVTRPPEQPTGPARPRPGFLEAVLWCAAFVAVQMCGAVPAVAVAFAGYAFAAPEPGKFATEQLEAVAKSTRPGAGDVRPAMPLEFGQALAWGMLAAQFASLLLTCRVLPRRIGPDWKREIGLRRPHGLHLFLVLLLVPGFMIMSDLIQTLFLWATGMTPPSALRALNGVFGRFPWPLTALAVALGPGLVEELWCRGFLGRGLCSRYGVALGAVCTSLLFAAMHLDPSQMLVITLMGLYLHFVYFATRSIWPPVLLHATNNGLAILLALALPEGDIAVPVIVHILGFSVLLFGSVALWTSRATLEPLTLGDDTWREAGGWEPESPGVSAPPAGANVRLGHEAVSPAAVVFALLAFVALVVLMVRFAR
ncbi:MAG: lysostaphin resistance A-like protein [Gemmata sp.]